VAPAGSLQGRSAFLVSTSLQGGPVPEASAYSSAQQPIRVERPGTGIYDISFDGLTRNVVGGSADHVQVTAYGDGTNWCKVGGWDSGAEDLSLTVRCFTPSGTPADAAFSVLLVERGRAGNRRLGYVWANGQTSDVLYTPTAAWNYNSTNVSNTAIRHSPGVYEVNWVGLGQLAQISTAETNLITAHGSDSTYCQVEGWGGAGTVFHCYAPDGTPANSQFTAMWIE
jgi:hypothetical protein